VRGPHAAKMGTCYLFQKPQEFQASKYINLKGRKTIFPVSLKQLFLEQRRETRLTLRFPRRTGPSHDEISCR
jgi:hypothetical protein